MFTSCMNSCGGGKGKWPAQTLFRESGGPSSFGRRKLKWVCEMWGLQKNKKNGKVVRKQQMQQQSPHRQKKKRSFHLRGFSLRSAASNLWLTDCEEDMRDSRGPFRFDSPHQAARTGAPEMKMTSRVSGAISLHARRRSQKNGHGFDWSPVCHVPQFRKKSFVLNYNILFVLVFKCPGFDITVNLIFLFFFKESKAKKLDSCMNDHNLSAFLPFFLWYHEACWEFN